MITRKESRNECHAYDPNDEQYYVSLPAEPSRLLRTLEVSKVIA